MSSANVSWDEEAEKEEIKSIIRHRLSEGPCTVVFTKRDGTERTMKCTTKFDLVVPYEKKTDRTKPENQDVAFVYDLDINEWRSFKFETVRSFVPHGSDNS
jgi:hypothetical protein